MLQAGRRADGTAPEVFLSDFFDFSVYVDASEADIQRWYVERFLALRRTAFHDTTAYFHRFAAPDRRAGAGRPRSASGPRSTGPTCATTSPRPGPAPGWCCRRRPTTRSAGSCSASSDARAGRLAGSARPVGVIW